MKTTADYQTSDHLKEYKKLEVEIVLTGANTTAYQIKQTQGAEFGEEAERVRATFEIAVNRMLKRKTKIISIIDYEEPNLSPKKS